MDKAISLYPQYARNKICRVLRLSGMQFKRCMNRIEQNQSDVAFVMAQPSKNISSTDLTSITIILQGKTNRLELNVPLAKLAQVLPQLNTIL